MCHKQNNQWHTVHNFMECRYSEHISHGQEGSRRHNRKLNKKFGKYYNNFGMTIDYTTSGKVIILMYEYVV